jgi:hypothetical protein
MIDLLNPLKNAEPKEFLFWFCALSGSGMLLIQFLLSWLGALDSDEGLESAKFKWLSKQALSSFLMMFGWISLSCSREFALGGAASALVGLVAGALSAALLASLFKAAGKLRSSGTVFNIDDCIGKTALVYQRIPKEGSGKISLSLQDLTTEIEALSLDGEEIPSFTQVIVMKKSDERTVFVRPTK